MADINKKYLNDAERMEVTELKDFHKVHVVESVLCVDELDTEAGIRTTPTEPFDRGVGKIRWILTCIGLYVGALLYGLDTTIAANVQGPILESLGEIEKLAWVGVGFPMGSVAVILLVGALLHHFEVKRLMMASIAIFEVGSAICGAAPTMNIMTLGRVVAGAGGGGMYLGALTYLTHYTSVKERPLYNGLLGICWGTGCIIGPLLGGGFAVTSATWRWAFYINLPLAGIMSPIYIFVNPPYQPRPGVPTRTKLGEIDWLGAFLNAGSFILLPTAITFGGSSYAWSSATNIALWSLTGAFIVAYAIQSIYCIGTTPAQRLFPVHLLKSRTMLCLFFTTATTSTALSIGVYYIPVFFQFTKGDDAIHAAVRLLPFICITILFILLTGGLLPATGMYTPFYVASGVFLIIGGALMYTVNNETSASAIYGYSVLMAIGIGFGMQTAYSVVVVKFPKDIQNAIGLVNVAQIGAVAICLAVASSIYQNVGYDKLADALAAYHVPPAILRDALGGAASSVTAQAPPATIALALNAIIDTIALEYLLVLAAGVVCLISALAMRWEKLSLEMVAGG